MVSAQEHEEAGRALRLMAEQFAAEGRPLQAIKCLEAVAGSSAAPFQPQVEAQARCCLGGSLRRRRRRDATQRSRFT